MSEDPPFPPFPAAPEEAPAAPGLDPMLLSDNDNLAPFTAAAHKLSRRRLPFVRWFPILVGEDGGEPLPDHAFVTDGQEPWPLFAVPICKTRLPAKASPASLPRAEEGPRCEACAGNIERVEANLQESFRQQLRRERERDRAHPLRAEFLRHAMELLDKMPTRWLFVFCQSMAHIAKEEEDAG